MAPTQTRMEACDGWGLHVFPGLDRPAARFPVTVSEFVDELAGPKLVVRATEIGWLCGFQLVCRLVDNKMPVQPKED